MTLNWNPTDTPQEGDFRVWYAPQIPMPAFTVGVPDFATGVEILEVLVRFSLYEYKNRVKGDFADAGGISRWESDGEGGFDWFDVDAEQMEWEREHGE